MFGKKKEITQKLLVNNEGELEDYNQNEQKKEKNKNTQPKNADNNFIFYGSDNKFTKQLEIYATLKGTKDTNEIQITKNKKLVLVVVDSNSPMEQLSYKICESFGQFPEYQNLEGLTATNLTKMDEEKKNLPLEGKVGDFLRNGDIIYLDLISNEIWIKTNISISNVTNKNLKLNIVMDVKIKVESSFKELRHKLLKSAIICYLDKYSKSENNFHYIVLEFSLFTSDYGNIEENKLKTFDDMKIKQLFNFKNNMKVEIKFYPLEFVLFQKLKAIPRPEKEKAKKKILWNRFKTLRFRELLYNIKYLREKEYIFNYIKNLFKDKTFQSKCYVYSLNEDYNASVTEDIFDENKIEDEKDLSNLNINTETDGDGGDADIENALKKNKTIVASNKSILNKSSRSKTLISKSNIFPEDIKWTLIVVPPNEEEDNDDEKDLSFSNKKYSTKEFDVQNTNKDSDNEDDEDNEIIVHRKRKDSFYEKFSVTKKKFGTLDFEIIEKNNLLDKDDDEMIIYKELKPKEIMKNPSRLSSNKWRIPNKSLCKDFDKYFDRNKFIDYVSGLSLINIQKGALERSTIPNFRGFKIVKKKNMLRNKKRKKKKLKYGSFYGQFFPVKRLNFEIGIFSFFVFGIFIFLSYLISNTYY